MPYIITTTGPRHVTFDDGNFIDGSAITRTAVATLEEARRFAAQNARRCISVNDRATAILAPAHSLPESGGTVGPLPDGTVIEVKHLHWDEMRAVARVPRTASDGMTVAAFNAQA